MTHSLMFLQRKRRWILVIFPRIWKKNGKELEERTKLRHGNTTLGGHNQELLRQISVERIHFSSPEQLDDNIFLSFGFDWKTGLPYHIFITFFYSRKESVQVGNTRAQWCEISCNMPMISLSFKSFPQFRSTDVCFPHWKWAPMNMIL